MNLSHDVIKGQQVYNSFTLAIYDFLLFNILTKRVWGCSKESLLTLFRENISSNHLDVGVGSGYLLDKSLVTSSTQRLVLMDLNEQCLAFTAKRLARYQPLTYRENVLAPLVFKGARFDSISINYLLHCLPGSMTSKMIVFEQLYELLAPGGVIFGCTIISDPKEKRWIAEKLLRLYNDKGVFCNSEDTTLLLKDELMKRYQHVCLKHMGYAAQFVIHKPEN